MSEDDALPKTGHPRPTGVDRTPDRMRFGGVGSIRVDWYPIGDGAIGSLG